MTFNPFKDDLLQIHIIFNYPCSKVSNRFVKPLLKINTQLLGDELINEVRSLPWARAHWWKEEGTQWKGGKKKERDVVEVTLNDSILLIWIILALCLLHLICVLIEIIWGLGWEKDISPRETGE